MYYRRFVVERGGPSAAEAAEPQLGVGNAPQSPARRSGKRLGERRGERLGTRTQPRRAARGAAARAPPAAPTGSRTTTLPSGPSATR